MNIELSIIDSTKGFLDPEEGLCLYQTAKEASLAGPCLEIGSYCGKSTLYIGTACKENGAVLFSIDHHCGSEEQQPGEEYFDPDTYDPVLNIVNTFPLFRETLKKGDLENTVVPIVAPSALAARQWSTPLSLVFIDGGHSFESAMTDYTKWSGHIISGGFLVIHDIFEDPKDGGQAPYQIYQQALSSGLFDPLIIIKTLGVLKRKQHTPASG